MHALPLFCFVEGMTGHGVTTGLGSDRQCRRTDGAAHSRFLCVATTFLSKGKASQSVEAYRRVYLPILPLLEGHVSSHPAG